MPKKNKTENLEKYIVIFEFNYSEEKLDKKLH